MNEEGKRNARLEVVRQVEVVLDRYSDGYLRPQLEALCASIREAGGDIRKDIQLQMFFRTDASQQGCGANPPHTAQAA